MKKLIFILFVVFGVQVALAQKKNKKDNERDTIKTEVINVVTSYTPTIADAFKIKKNPKFNLSKKSKKKKLKYSIFSAPVASTFVPKSGVVKGIDVGKKERLFDNYVAAGFGNYTTPFAELFLHDGTRFDNDMGFYLKYISSVDGVETTPLNSGYRNIAAKGYYSQEERYFNWKAGFNIESNQYNWYGLPTINFDDNSINAIQEQQTYNFYEIEGELSFEDSYFETITSSASYFSDDFGSSEIKLDVAPKFLLPLNGISRNLNDLSLNTSLSFLKGKFGQDYNRTIRIDYSFLNIGLHPVYRFEQEKLSVKLGAKVFMMADMENSITDFLVYPDIQVTYPVFSDMATIYLGANGDLNMNTYKFFSDENPFVSPTLFLTQTNQQYNVFGGVNGKLTSSVSFDVKASYSATEDQALFVRNNSKSDGVFNPFNGLLGYEYGNSFNVLYDDITQFSLFAELEFDLTKRITAGFSGNYVSYTTTNQQEAWNLPTTKGTVFAKYKNDKWYATMNTFYVGERKDVFYTGTYPNATNSIQTLESYMDVNLNGGYHFSDLFSVFLKLNNILNNDYQRFANFNVQGFQVLAGITYKFDF